MRGMQFGGAIEATACELRGGAQHFLRALLYFDLLQYVCCSHPRLKLHDANLAVALVTDVGVEHTASLLFSEFRVQSLCLSVLECFRIYVCGLRRMAKRQWYVCRIKRCRGIKISDISKSRGGGGEGGRATHRAGKVLEILPARSVGEVLHSQAVSRRTLLFSERIVR